MILIIKRKKIYVLSISFSDESLTKQIVNKISSSVSKEHYDILNTELGDFQTSVYIQENNKNFFDDELKRLDESEEIIIVFPYLITGTPGILIEFLNKLFSKKGTRSKKGIVLTYTEFPKESFYPNSLHQSSIKRKLHFLNWIILKNNGIEPYEPIIMYNTQQKTSMNYLSHKSTNESFRINSKKSNKENKEKESSKLAMENISGIAQDNFSYNEINDKESKSLNTKGSLQRKRTIEYRNEFLTDISKIIKMFDYFPRLDTTDI